MLTIATTDNKQETTMPKHISTTRSLGCKPHDSSRVGVLRGVFILCLMAAAGICAYVAYHVIDKVEHDSSHSTYTSLAETALVRARKLFSQRIKGASMLSDLFSNAFPNAEDWPFVYMPGFETAAKHLAIIGQPPGVQSIRSSFGVHPLVRPDQVTAFEAHAKLVYEKEQNPNGTGIREELGNTFGIFARDENGTVYHSDGTKSTYNHRYNISAPLFQAGKKTTSVLMKDFHASDSLGPWIESTLDCSMTIHERQQQDEQVMQTLQSDTQNDDGMKMYSDVPPCIYATSLHIPDDLDYPSINVGVPIVVQQKHNNKPQVVGFVSTPFHLDATLQDIVPDYVDEVIAVIGEILDDDGDDDDLEDHSDPGRRHLADQGLPPHNHLYTYGIYKGSIKTLGPGDLHDPALDKYARFIVLNDIDTAAAGSVRYLLTLYPSQKTFEKFHTNIPLSVALGFIGVFVLCGAVFFAFDFFVRDEAQKNAAVLEMKRRFVRFISHEIRTPLNTVFMGLELLKADMESESAVILDMDIEPIQTESRPHDNQSNSQEKMYEWKQIIYDVIENCRNAVSTLNDILTYDKIEAGSLHYEFTPVSIRKLVRRTVREFQVQAKNRNITLNLHEELMDNENEDTEKVEESRDIECGVSMETDVFELYVMGDRIKLAQVIRNLLSNALKFSAENQSVTIRIRYHQDDQHPKKSTIEPVKRRQSVDAAVETTDLPSSISSRDGEDCYLNNPRAIEIIVEDNGVGMDEDQLAKLFGEGVQFNANRLQHGGGSGLGLFISRNIVHRHGGTIQARSDGTGHGACFTVSLPIMKNDDVKIGRGHAAKSLSVDHLQDVSLSKVDIQAEANTSKEVANQKLQRRVLVVEDVISNSKMLCRVLERAGHSCSTAFNGQEAVDAVLSDMQLLKSNRSHQAFDTILMDYEMPIMNGPTATQKIREIGFRGIIIGVTGNALAEDVEYFKSLGADDVVAKPVRFGNIEECWERLGHSPVRIGRTSAETFATCSMRS